MLPIFFVIPPSKVASKTSGNVHIYLQILTRNDSTQRMWQKSWTAAAQKWRYLTITKLTQKAGTLCSVKNLPKQKLQLTVAAADLQIQLFFNCRPH